MTGGDGTLRIAIHAHVIALVGASIDVITADEDAAREFAADVANVAKLGDHAWLQECVAKASSVANALVVAVRWGGHLSQWPERW